MRKFIKNKIVGLAIILAVGITACDTASQETEPVVSPNGYPVATFANATGTTVDEGDTIKYNITIDKTIDRSVTFSFEQTGGTCTSADYTVVPGVLQPYTTSTQVLIIFKQDYDFAATETLSGEIGAFSIADRYLLNPSTVNPTLSATVNNYVSDVLEVIIWWEQEASVLEIVEKTVAIDAYPYEYTYEDTVEVVTDASSEVDWDIFVTEATGFDINDPWAKDYVDYAATGSNPEVLNLSGLPAGTYVIWADLWTNGFVYYYEILDPTLTLPILSYYTRQGTALIEHEIAQDASQVPLITQLGDDDSLTEYFDGIIAYVTVDASGNYTITDYSGTAIGPYKSSAARSPRPAQFNK